MNLIKFNDEEPVWKLPQLAPLQKGFWPDHCRANSGCIAWPGTG